MMKDKGKAAGFMSDTTVNAGDAFTAADDSDAVGHAFGSTAAVQKANSGQPGNNDKAPVGGSAMVWPSGNNP